MIMYKYVMHENNIDAFVWKCTAAHHLYDIVNFCYDFEALNIIIVLKK